MLDAIRKHASGWVVKIFLGVLILSFGIWGIADIFRGGRDPTVAKVGDVEITANQFNQEFRRSLQRLQAALGTQMDAERARQLGLADTTLQQMIGRALMDQKIASMGIVVSDPVIRQEIVANPAFKGRGGEFDRGVFEQRLRAAGLNEAYFVAESRRDIGRDALLGSLAGAGPAPKAMAETVYRYREEKRIAEIVIFPQDAVALPADPDEAALSAFHQAEAQRFSAPEYRSVTLASLKATDLAKDVQVVETELKDEYESRIDEFSFPEKRKLEQIVYPDEAAAKAAKARIVGGADFAAVARETLGRKPEELALGEVAREDLPEELAGPAFVLAVGALSDPVASPFGWHLIRVLAIAPPRRLAFDEAKGQLRDELKLRRAADNVASLANKLEDLLAGGTRLDEIAGRLGLRLDKIEAIDSDGRDPSGKEVALAAGERPLIEAIFGTAEGTETRLVETVDGGLIVGRVDKVTPSALRPLASIRNDVLDAWRQDQRRQIAEKQAADAKTAIEGGQGIADVAKKMGREYRITAALRRSGPTGDALISSALAGRLFALNVGGVAVDASAAGDGSVVARLKEIVPADPAADAAGVERLAKALAEAINADVLAQYQQALRDEIGVRINAQIFERLFQ